MRYPPIDIRCPACGQLAKFEEPFEFLSKNEAGIGYASRTKQPAVILELATLPPPNGTRCVPGLASVPQCGLGCLG